MPESGGTGGNGDGTVRVPIISLLNDIKTDMGALKSQVTQMGGELQGVKRDVTQIRDEQQMSRTSRRYMITTGIALVAVTVPLIVLLIQALSR